MATTPKIVKSNKLTVHQKLVNLLIHDLEHLDNADLTKFISEASSEMMHRSQQKSG